RTVFTDGNLLTRGRVDLDQSAPRQSRRCDSRARGRIVPKKPGIDVVHGCEIGHATEIHDAPDNLLGVGTSGLEQNTYVAQDAVSLLNNPSLDHLLRRRIQGNLSADEDETVGTNGLRIWAKGC